MSATAAIVIGVSVAVVLVIAVVVWLFWSSWVGPRPFEKPDNHYRREMGSLHSARNVKIARAKKNRRKAWAAGSAGAIGPDIGGGCAAGGNAGGCGAGGGCGGGGCGGGGGGCGGGGN
jgi:hypothetical protein